MYARPLGEIGAFELVVQFSEGGRSEIFREGETTEAIAARIEEFAKDVLADVARREIRRL